MAKEICSRCKWWATDDGTPYCVHKPLYTETKYNHLCDEFSRLAQTMFTEKEE